MDPKPRIKRDWLILVLALAVILFLGTKVVYAYLDLIRFTGENYNINTNVNSYPSCPSLSNINGNLLDSCTGLTWAASDATNVNGTITPVNWSTAMTICPTGFRLPTIDELYSLANPPAGANLVNGIYQSTSPAISPAPIPGLGTYWSSTEYQSNTNYARSVDFLRSAADNIIYSKTVGLNVRCIQQ